MTREECKSLYRVGQEVCLLVAERSNYARTYKEKFLKGIVKSIGSKYLTVTYGCSDYKFSLEDDLQQYVTAGSIDFVLYQSLEEAKKKVEAQKLFRMIREAFAWKYEGEYSLDTLRTIASALGIQ